MNMNTRRLYVVGLIVRFLPETRCFKLKNKLYKWAGVKINGEVRICSSVHIIGDANLSIGDNVWIGPESFISAAADINIGSFVNIAPRVSLICGTHDIDYEGISIAGVGRSNKIVIKDGCWICTGATILGTSIIGYKSIVAAGAITKGKYEDNQLLTGILAKSQSLLMKKSR